MGFDEENLSTRLVSPENVSAEQKHGVKDVFTALVNPKTVAETIGTFLLVFTIQVAVGSGSDLAPLAIGAILISSVFAAGPVSGGQFNPAVSLAVVLRGGMPALEIIPYWIAQILGGTLGALLGGAVCGSFATVALGADGVTLVQALLAELVVTFALCYTVLSVATNPKADGNSYFGLAIGLVVMSGAVGVGPISGGAFNPAVSLGLSFAAGAHNIGYAFMVAASCLVGGAIAALGYLVCNPESSGSSVAPPNPLTSSVLTG